MSNLAVQNTRSEEETSTKAKASLATSSTDLKGARKADGAFRTISEVADELDVPQHVLRFWETKFSQVKPLKRGGGRRYYRPEDVALLKHIHYLLYSEGYTIKGAQKLLKGQGKNQIAAQVMAAEEQAQPKVQIQAANAPQQAQPQQSAQIFNLSDHQRSALEDMLTELKALRALIPQDAA